MVFSVRLHKKVGKSTRHKKLQENNFFPKILQELLGNLVKFKEITGLEDFNVSLPFAMCLKPEEP